MHFGCGCLRVGITGSNFGVPASANKLPVVFVGSSLCNITSYTPSHIDCTIEPSIEVDLPVTVFQNGGVSSATTNATVPTLSFIKCQPGTFQMLVPAVNLTCQNCAPGRFTSQEGQTGACSPCSSGSFQPFARQSNCAQCPAGTFQPSSDGATSCQNCTAGSYSTSTGLSACSICLPGSFLNATSSNAPCKLCAAGYAQSATNASSCEICPAGRFSVTTGAASCEPCEKGTFSNQTGSFNCISCRPVCHSPCFADVFGGAVGYGRVY